MKYKGLIILAKKEESVVKRIRVEGPSDPENGATVMRFNRDGRKQPIDIIAGQVLTVGEKEDVTEEEAQRLISYASWNVKEVEE